MTVVATIPCKVCRAVFALFSDTLFSRGGREKTCDICGHVIAHWTGFRMPTIKFVSAKSPRPRSE
jgi:ribosomal protein S27E